MKKYNKLVRDLIPEIIRKNGEEPVTHIASDEEYWIELQKKLHEEVEEFCAAESDTERVEELSDVMEVIDALCKEQAIVWDDVRKAQVEKRKKRCGFDKRIILDDVK